MRDRRRLIPTVLSSGAVPVPIPTAAGAAFDYVPFTIMQAGNNFTTGGFNLRTYSGCDAAEGVDYYCDPVAGNDANTGLSWDQAEQNFYTAAAHADARVIFIRPGTYGFNAGQGGWRGGVGAARAVICEGGQAILTPGILGLAYTAVGAHYTASTTETIAAAWDMASTVADGSYTRLTLKASEAEVDAEANSFYWAANVLYVHLTADRAPDANFIPCRGNTVALNMITGVYLENMTFLFSTGRHCRVRYVTAGDPIHFFAKGCIWSHAGATTIYELVDIDGNVFSIFDTCIAEYGRADGFNYHLDTALIPQSIEINCIGRYCGDAADATDNGSSTHDAAPILRVMGDYHHNYGANVGDVGGAKIWMLGTESHHSLTSNPLRNAGFLVGDAGATEMWLDSVYGHDNTHLLYAEDRAIYKRNLRGTGLETTVGTGTITAY